ncbi:MAG: hypothetical protein AAGC53_00380 [Actinomycetota bacterium]
MHTRSKLTGAAVGAVALMGTVFGLTAVAGADDGESSPETGVAERVDVADVGDNVVTVELDTSNEVGDGKVVTEETFEAEFVDEMDIDEDAIIIDISEADEGDWEEFVVD